MSHALALERVVLAQASYLQGQSMVWPEEANVFVML